ncbi:MAG TPA: 3-phosphoshikimate 1-carboxyvinyltransferase [Candidatus Krumholzibacteria bacterium]|nr:3-phosphoshikimate 1-carboxyvinyltransferase [Candidatus Krumholzibacteria bacterium]
MHFVPPARGPLQGRLRVPGDKSVTHRALLFSVLADASCRVRSRLRAEDTDRSLAAVRALGVRVDGPDDDLLLTPAAVPAPGAAPDNAPVLDLDCGNSGTTTRLLLGLLAGRRVRARLDGDASLRSRPMARVVDPLRAMGARIRYLEQEGRLPLEITGAALTGADHVLAVPSAQVKSALLLAGLTAAGPTSVTGGGGSRDHTERLLRAMGADLHGDAAADRWTIRPAAPLRPYDLDVPGDPSSAAFLLAAAALVPGSEVRVENVLTNPSRCGFADVWPGGLSREDDPAPAAEPVGAFTARAGLLDAKHVGGAVVPALIDEVPVLAVLAARARGATRFADCADLRHKESDRIAATAAGLRALGVRVDTHDDGLTVHGEPDGFPAAGPVRVTTHGDHRIAMAFAVAGLASRGGVELDDAACVAVSYPDFFRDLDGLQAPRSG